MALHFTIAELQKQQDYSGIKLSVKNTFYDVEEQGADPLPMMALKRHCTAPPLQGHCDSDTDAETESTAPTTPRCEEEGLLSRPMLHRDTTHDFFEGSDEAAAWKVSEQLPVQSQGDDVSTALAALQPGPLQRDTTHDPFEGSDALTLEVPKWEPWQQVLWAQLPQQQFDTVAAPLMIPMHSVIAPEVMLPEASAAFQPQTVSYRVGHDGVTRVLWTVDGRKLRNSDKVAVSPLFMLFDDTMGAAPLPFKMMINPAVSSEGKGGASFQKARGHGVIQLKCEAPRNDNATVPLTFWWSVSSGRPDKPLIQPARGPVTEDFKSSGVCGLPKNNDVWNFPESVDDTTKTFVVCLAVLPPWHHMNSTN